VLTKDIVPIHPVSRALRRPQTKKIPSPAVPPAQSLEYLGNVNHAVNEKLFAEIKKRIARGPHDDIYLTVTSAGGPTGIAMCFYDTMRYILKPNLITVGTGDVDSSGIIIFLSGERRYISKHTTLLLHLAGRRFDPSVRFNAGEIEAMAKEDRLKDFQYASVIADNSFVLTPQDVLDMMEKNTVLSPDELVSLGLAGKILT